MATAPCTQPYLLDQALTVSFHCLPSLVSPTWLHPFGGFGLRLAEDARRGIPASQENQTDTVAKWLISIFDDGVGLAVIRSMSALSDRQTKRRLKRALDADSGNPPRRLITPAPDGTPGRVSRLAPNGRLIHRAFDGAFPQGFPQRDAVAQCQQVLLHLIAQHDQTARKRAVTMLAMAEDNLHTFDYEPSRRVNHILERAGMKGLGISNHLTR